MPHVTPQQLLSQFDEWSLGVTTHDHKPVFTVDDHDPVVDALPGAHCKSLFLKPEKTDEYYLVVMLGQDRLDLKQMHKALNCRRFSFASAEELQEIMGVIPGSVTPFGLINDTAKDVVVILDKKMLEHELLNYHPLQNNQTTAIAKEDFMKFIELVGHRPLIMDIPKRV
ncbi:MAG: prolyl-tRNA synthetase associated domain-containing protein [Alphaproteobacteria bacterium]